MKIPIALVNGKTTHFVLDEEGREKWIQVPVEVRDSDTWNDAVEQAQDLSESTGEIVGLFLDLDGNISVMSQAKLFSGEVEQ